MPVAFIPLVIKRSGKQNAVASYHVFVSEDHVCEVLVASIFALPSFKTTLQALSGGRELES